MARIDDHVGCRWHVAGGALGALRASWVMMMRSGVEGRGRMTLRADGIAGKPQAGVLIYTAAADSDGTLGGLVELGKPENLGRLLKQALARAGICSSDPLCSEHNPEDDRSLHAAACHACSFVSETSCEKGNRYIDRTLIVPTLEIADAAFFG